MPPYEPMSPRGDGAAATTKKQTKLAPRKTSPKNSAAKSPIDIITLMEKPNLFGPWFEPQESWFSWKVFLAAGFGLPIERTGNPAEALELYRQCTGRKNWPTQQANTLAMICGMRAGKSRIASLIAVYLCSLKSYSAYLAPGERGYLPVIAADRKQARVVFSYAKAYVTEADIFKALVDGEPLTERISFHNNVDLEIMTASYKSTKGYTNVGGVLDEIAFFSSEDSANPDFEIVASVRRGMRTIPNSTMVMLSSPYARRGVLWETYKAHWAVEDSPTLVWNAPTWVMNRTITREDLQDEYDRDPEKANADYGAEFRKDVERFASLPVIEACIDKDRTESGPRTDTHYFGFVDPSGGSQDSMTLAIGHGAEYAIQDGVEQHVIIDAVYERRPPFPPDDVVSEFASYLKNYGITTVIGDRYAGEWPAERFAAHGIVYETSTKVRSDLYRDMLPLLNSRRIRLPDLPRLTNQIWNLERTKARAGKDTIGHPKGGHDDLANAVAGVAAFLAESGPVSLVW